jgi:hypothetical protein
VLPIRWAAWVLIAAAALTAWVVSDWFNGVPYERPFVLGLSVLAFVVVPALLQPLVISPRGAARPAPHTRS